MEGPPTQDMLVKKERELEEGAEKQYVDASLSRKLESVAVLQIISRALDVLPEVNDESVLDIVLTQLVSGGQVSFANFSMNKPMIIQVVVAKVCVCVIFHVCENLATFKISAATFKSWVEFSCLSGFLKAGAIPIDFLSSNYLVHIFSISTCSNILNDFIVRLIERSMPHQKVCFKRQFPVITNNVASDCTEMLE